MSGDGFTIADRPDEEETKRLLARQGLRVPASLRARAGEAPTPPFPGPYVVKVCSAEVLHKTEQGGVRLSVGPDELPVVVHQMQSRFPGADILVEEQVRHAGMEFILGAFRDPTFGPAVMAGTGGILTEIYRDVAFRLVPCTAGEALRMLRELAVFPVLDGFRGMTLDAAGLAGMIARVSSIVENLGDRFSQLDLNPVVFSPGGWTILDAKLVLAGPGHPAEAARSLPS